MFWWPTGLGVVGCHSLSGDPDVGRPAWGVLYGLSGLTGVQGTARHPHMASAVAGGPRRRRDAQGSHLT